MALEYLLLGPLEVRAAHQVLSLGGRRQQALLAVLLLNAGETVPFDRLVDELWDRPPPTARRQVGNAAVAVRRIVERSGGGPLVTRNHGYRLETGGDRLDVDVFEALQRDAGSAVEAGRTADAVGLLQKSTDLWRGPVLAGLSSGSIDVARQSLAERRLTAIERLAELRLELGEVTSLIGWLVGLVAEHPARETLRATLMRALHRAGRPADALAVFAEGRRFLAEEFGTDPGPELRALHGQILRSDAAPGPADRAGPLRAVPARGGPCFLPNDLPDFTGRGAEVGWLTSLTASDSAGATAVTTVEGMGGVGKTALAVHVAHRLRAAYPDGQYFVDLRGFTEGELPMRSDAALDVLLRQSGIAAEEIPVDADARRDLWRARLAGRRVLVVLDNAVDAAQVRPLLPASPGSMVLVTSRRQLLALDGAVPLPLDVLPISDATALFRRSVAPGRADAESAGTRDVVALCRGLPLAIRIAASRFRRRPTWTLAHLAEQLRAQRGFVAGDRSVAGAIALSYRHLSPPNQRLFGLLGLVPGPDFDAYAAAALAGIPSAAAAEGLEELLECSLLSQDTLHRYRLHDLVRDCARDLAARALPESDLHAARYRLFDYYLRLVDAHGRQITMSRPQLQPDLRYPPESLPEAASQKQSIERIEAEYANLVAAAHHASANGWHRHAWQLPCLMQPFLIRVGRRSDTHDLARNALAAARKMGDRHGESVALDHLAFALQEQGRLPEVRAALERAIEISHDLDDLAAVAGRLRNLGNFLVQAGELDEAGRRYTEARDLAQHLGDGPEEINLTINLAVVDCNLGRYENALGHLDHALAYHRRDERIEGEAVVLINIGWVGQLRGRDGDAIVALDRALELSRAIGFRRGEALALGWLAISHRRLGRVGEAIAAGRAAVDTARRCGLREPECDGLNGLAEAYLAGDRHAEAEAAFREAERVARASALPLSIGRALEGLAHLAAGRGEPDQAGELWRRALASYPAGTIDAEYPRVHLSARDPRSVRCMRCQTTRPRRNPAAGGF